MPEDCLELRLQTMGTIGNPQAAAAAKEAAPGGKEGRKTGNWVLAATILGASMAYIDGTAINVALPALQDQLGATIADVQWVVEAYALFLASLILVGGTLGDRYGRKLVYGLGAGIFAVSSALCGLSPGVEELKYFRALQGVGGALMIPGSLSIITSYFHESERGRAIGTWSAFSAITTAIGPVLGGWLIENISWRWIFFINVPISAVVIAILYFRVPESKGDLADSGIDYKGAALATLGLGGVVFGFVESSIYGFFNPVVAVSVAGGALFLILFVIAEKKSKSPMVPLGLFRSSTFSGANIVTFLMYAALAGSLFFLPFAMIQVYGYTATGAGAAFMPIILLMFVFSRWSGGLVDKYGARGPLVVGNILQAAGYVLFAVLGREGQYVTTFFPGMLLLGAGLALCVAPLTTAVMNAVGSGYSGTASGINNAVSRVSGLISVAVLGIVILAVFNSGLDTGLDLNGIPAEVRLALDAERVKLAGADIPAGIAPEIAQTLNRLIRESYVTGFNIIMYIGAALTVLSAFISYLTVTDRPDNVRG